MLHQTTNKPFSALAQIIIKPLLEDGLLLYSGHHEYGDYISLCLNMGYVEFTFDLGSGPATVRYVSFPVVSVIMRGNVHVLI